VVLPLGVSPSPCVLSRCASRWTLDAEIAELRGAWTRCAAAGAPWGARFRGARGGEGEAQALTDEAVFLRNVLVGGLGLALIPVLLPVTLQGVVQQAGPGPNEEVCPPSLPQPLWGERQGMCVLLPLPCMSPYLRGFRTWVTDSRYDPCRTWIRACTVSLCGPGVCFCPWQLGANLNLEASLLLQSMLNQQTEVLTDLKTLLPLVSPEAAPEVRAAQAEEFCLNIPPPLQSPDSESFCNAVEALRAAKGPAARGGSQALRRTYSRVPRCAALYCATLYCAVLFCAVLYGMT